jgi:Uma2 family endonuclease
MNVPAVKRMAIADFLVWSERQERGRYELVNGEIVARAPERAAHVDAKASIWQALARAIKAAEAPCKSYVDGLGVAIDAQTVYEPDVLVNCGDPIAPDAMLAPAPVVIVEVLSTSSRHIDKSVKLAGYFKLESLVHHLVVDLERRTVLHYRRQGADEPILLRIVTEGAIRLDPPGLDLALSEIFA